MFIKFASVSSNFIGVFGYKYFTISSTISILKLSMKWANFFISLPFCDKDKLVEVILPSSLKFKSLISIIDTSRIQIDGVPMHKLEINESELGAPAALVYFNQFRIGTLQVFYWLALGVKWIRKLTVMSSINPRYMMLYRCPSFSIHRNVAQMLQCWKSHNFGKVEEEKENTR